MKLEMRSEYSNDRPSLVMKDTPKVYTKTTFRQTTINQPHLKQSRQPCVDKKISLNGQRGGKMKFYHKNTFESNLFSNKTLNTSEVRKFQKVKYLFLFMLQSIQGLKLRGMEVTAATVGQNINGNKETVQMPTSRLISAKQSPRDSCLSTERRLSQGHKANFYSSQVVL